MNRYTLWLQSPDRDGDAPPIDLAADTAMAAVDEAYRLWVSSLGSQGPARLRIYENLSGGLIHELAPGPSC